MGAAGGAAGGGRLDDDDRRHVRKRMDCMDDSARATPNLALGRSVGRAATNSGDGASPQRPPPFAFAFARAVPPTTKAASLTKASAACLIVGAEVSA